MRKLILFGFVFGLFGLVVNAQSADEWMDKVSNTYQKSQSYYIKFEMTDSQSPKAETGELFASKEKYNVEILDIRQMYDGKNLYTVSKEDREVTVSQPKKDGNDFLSPVKIINLYKSNFKTELNKSEAVKGLKIQYIKLTPKTKSEIEYAVIGINTKDASLYSYKEFYSGGGSRYFVVKEYLENVIVPRALFKFDQSKYEKDGFVVTAI